MGEYMNGLENCDWRFEKSASARKKGLDDTELMLWKLMRSHENRKPYLP